MTASTHTLTIPAWANGPDGSGNGGWTAGLLAGAIATPNDGVAVSLRVPPPLERALRIDPVDAGASLIDDSIRDEPVLVATAHVEDVNVEVPAAVRAITIAQARAAELGFPFRDEHPFPRCIACGIARAGNVPSLHVCAGPVAGVATRDAAGLDMPVFATSWRPAADVADDQDVSHVRAEACWSALDCPSATPFADPHAEHASVLARIAVRIDAPIHVGASYVIAAWQRVVDGRKQYSCSAIIDEHGAVAAVADALWIQVRPR